MSEFLFIFTNIILPIFLQIGVGFLVQKKFQLNVKSLSKSTLFVFMPALLFVKIYQAPLTASTAGTLILYASIMSILLIIISTLISKILKLSYGFTGVFINSISFYNAGNYCIPLLVLLFNDPYAVTLIVLIIFGNNLFSYTLGIYNASRNQQSGKNALLSIVKMPMIYAISSALLLNALNIKIITPIWSSLNIISQGMVPIAIFTLGAQLATIKINLNDKYIYISNFIRLLISPIIAYMIINLLNAEGMMAQIMFISSGAPTAINTVLLAVEYGNRPDFASKAVFSSTIFSMFTMSVVVYLSTILF